MDKTEARSILADAIRDLRGRSYADLVELVAEAEHREVVGSSGVTYQVEIQGVWDSERGRNVRILVHIDDGGWRAFVPLTDSFIVRPDGSFVE